MSRTLIELGLRTGSVSVPILSPAVASYQRRDLGIITERSPERRSGPERVEPAIPRSGFHGRKPSPKFSAPSEEISWKYWSR